MVGREGRGEQASGSDAFRETKEIAGQARAMVTLVRDAQKSTIRFPTRIPSARPVILRVIPQM